MKCPYCGAEITAADAVFCPECGRRFTVAPTAPPKVPGLGQQHQNDTAPPHNYRWILAVAAVLVVLVGSVIAFASYFDFTAEDWGNMLRWSDHTSRSVPSLNDDSTEHSIISIPAPTSDGGETSQADPPPETNEDRKTEETMAQSVPDAPEPITMVTLPGGTQAPIVDFIFPYSGSQALTTTDIDNAFAGLSSTEAALLSQQAINEIYARYGYCFHPELSDSAQWASQYFGALSWYNSIVHDSWSNTGEVPINRTESENIDLIVKWQVNHGYR